MYINYILGGVMENIFFETIKILVSLFVGILPFIATILTIIYYVYRDEKNKKIEKNREEKKFLREKLEVIADEIISYNLEVQVAERSRIVDEVDNVPKSYKKAFFLSQMYFPDLYEIIRRYELSIVARKTVKNENTGEYEPPYSRREEYDNFLEQISVEIEKINKM